MCIALSHSHTFFQFALGITYLLFHISWNRLYLHEIDAIPHRSLLVFILCIKWLQCRSHLSPTFQNVWLLFSQYLVHIQKPWIGLSDFIFHRGNFWRISKAMVSHLCSSWAKGEDILGTLKGSYPVSVNIANALALSKEQFSLGLCLECIVKWWSKNTKRWGAIE